MSSSTSKRALLRQKRKEQNRRKFTIAAIILLAGGLLFASAIVLPRIIMNRAKFSGNEGFTKGDQNAPVSVVQFSSYSCGFCKNFSEQQEPDFITNYVNTGEVYYRYVNIPANNPDSQRAAKASYCAAELNGFFDYRSFLYENATSPNGFSATNLANYARLAGLDIEKFLACLEGDAFSTAYLDDIQYAQSLGVTYTPSFLVNDQLVDANAFISTVETFLEK